MSNRLDISMSLATAEIDSREVVGNLLVDDDENLDAFPGLALQKSIETPFLCRGKGRSAKLGGLQ